MYQNTHENMLFGSFWNITLSLEDMSCYIAVDVKNGHKNCLMLVTDLHHTSKIVTNITIARKAFWNQKMRLCTIVSLFLVDIIFIMLTEAKRKPKNVTTIVIVSCFFKTIILTNLSFFYWNESLERLFRARIIFFLFWVQWYATDWHAKDWHIL